MFKITLRAARVNADLNIEESAQMLGISKATLRNYEIATQFLPTKEIVERMSTLYNIPEEFIDTPIREKRGLSHTRLYNIWSGIKQRCNNPNRENYRFYGGKGISICEEWETDFLKFYTWSIEHGYSDELVIDRIDPTKNYCPDNCRWITSAENIARVYSREV